MKGTNIAIFYGGLDKLTTPEDVEVVIEKVKEQESLVYLLYEPEYAHLDFVWGLDACVKVCFVKKTNANTKQRKAA